MHHERAQLSRAVESRGAARRLLYRRQAHTEGYSHQLQRYHVASGSWERAHRGIYRLRDYPNVDREDLIVLSLASHNRAGEPQAVVGHEMALALYELGDVNSKEAHLIVPPRFWKVLPERVQLHVARLDPADREEHLGIE